MNISYMKYKGALRVVLTQKVFGVKLFTLIQELLCSNLRPNSGCTFLFVGFFSPSKQTLG
jgi:hypothetical protein